MNVIRTTASRMSMVRAERMVTHALRSPAGGGGSRRLVGGDSTFAVMLTRNSV